MYELNVALVGVLAQFRDGVERLFSLAVDHPIVIFQISAATSVFLLTREPAGDRR